MANSVKRVLVVLIILWLMSPGILILTGHPILALSMFLLNWFIASSLTNKIIHKIPAHHFALKVNSINGEVSKQKLHAGLNFLLWPIESIYAIIPEDRVQIESTELKVDGQRFTTSDTKSFLVNPGSAALGIDFDYSDPKFVEHLCHFLHGHDNEVIVDANNLYKKIDEFFRQSLKKAIGSRTEAEILALKRNPIGVSEGLFSDIEKEMEHLFHKNHMPLKLISAVFDLDQPPSVEIGEEEKAAEQRKAQAKNAFIVTHIKNNGGAALISLYAAYTKQVADEESAAKDENRAVNTTLLQSIQTEIAEVIRQLQPFQEKGEFAWREHKGYTKEIKTTYSVPEELLAAAKKIFNL